MISVRAMWSPTPAAKNLLALAQIPVLRPRRSHYVAQYTPCTLAVYAWCCSYRFGPKTRYEAAGQDLPRQNFHPLDIMSFSWCTSNRGHATPDSYDWYLFRDWRHSAEGWG
jgi:hypothetical protein